MSGIASGIHSYSCALGADSIPIFILRTSKVGWDGFSSESPFLSFFNILCFDHYP